MKRLLLVASLVALITACDDKGKAPPVAVKSAADSADQLMFGVRVTLTNGGMKRADLLADTAYMYDDNTRTDMRKVNSVFYTVTGARNATLTSKKGLYNMRLGNMEAMGNVIVIAEDGRRLTTEQLRYDPNKNEISSDSAFVATDPQGRRQSGIGFITDPSLKVVRVMKASKTTGLRATVPER